MDLSWLEPVIKAAPEAAGDILRRFGAEAGFVSDVLARRRDIPEGWEQLLKAAGDIVRESVESGDVLAITRAVEEAEGILSPLSPLAKEYAVHCVGHAHIDMNWMWSWPETVATVNDTFSTVVRLMEEIPEFKFSQSQASVYQIMADYLPELYEKVKPLVAQGRWEVTACQWVEGDKNMASGEILCRHMLHTRRFMEQEMGLKPSDVTICWEPDTFGHPHTLPTILNNGGARRYYLHRGAHGPKLFWWQGKDGSRVLTFDDCDRGYNGVVNESITKGMADFVKATGMKDYIFVYGVGDHGGGPTRRDILRCLAMDKWPVFPRIIMSTTDAFYSAAERDAKDLPVIDKELNTVEEGCYTSQSVIKLDNRKGENALVEAELYSIMGNALAGMPYPKEGLDLGWRHTMFNQFHDILPGSGTRETYRYADGLFQEVVAQTGMAKTRALRAISERLDTASCGFGAEPGSYDAWGETSMGAGVGDGVAMGSVSTYSYGNPTCDAFAIFNPNPWSRSEVVKAKVWDRDFHGDRPAVRDGSGNAIPVQVLGDGWFWGHRFTELAFPTASVQGMGYKAFAVGTLAAAQSEDSAPGSCGGDGKGTIWNEFLEVTVDSDTGAISRLLDKRTGKEFATPSGRIGGLDFVLEHPHGMTAWMFGSVDKREALEVAGALECLQNGPYLASVVTKHKVGQSSFTLTISLSAGVPRVDFLLDGSWYERGNGEIGVPSLYATFPLDVTDSRALFEAPNGHVERTTDPTVSVSHTNRFSNCYSEKCDGLEMCCKESPGQKWVDLSGADGVGATLVNDSKYGFSAVGNTLDMTLIRSSYDPDPVPEQGRHTVQYALIPHDGAWTVSDATRAGFAFNQPLSVVGCGMHGGVLAPEKGYGEILTPNVMLSGIKKAEDSDALVIRFYEMEGKAVRARMRLDGTLVRGCGQAVQTDVIENALHVNTASLEDGVLSVDIPAFGMATVMLP